MVGFTAHFKIRALSTNSATPDSTPLQLTQSLEPECPPIACLIVGWEWETWSKQTSRQGRLFWKLRTRRKKNPSFAPSWALKRALATPFSSLLCTRNSQRRGVAISVVRISKCRTKLGELVFSPLPQREGSRRHTEGLWWGNTWGNWYLFGVFLDFCLLNF